MLPLDIALVLVCHCPRIGHVLFADEALPAFRSRPAAPRRVEPVTVAVHGQQGPRGFDEHPCLLPGGEFHEKIPRKCQRELFGVPELRVSPTLAGGAHGAPGLSRGPGVLRLGSMLDESLKLDPGLIGILILWSANFMIT